MNTYGHKTLYSTLAAVMIAALLVGFAGVKNVQAAGPWFVSPSGNNANDCLTAATACATINGAFAKADPGDTINVLAGTYAMNSAADSVTINKAGITIQGEGSNQTFITTSAPAGFIFSAMADNVTLTGLSIEKTDNVNQGIVYVQADGFTLDSSIIFGHYVFGTDETSRAMVVSYGSENMTITDNIFHHLRQPGYFNGSLAAPTTGIVSGNYTASTKGWVIDGANFNFTENTWGSGPDANIFDVAILAATPPDYYTDLIAVSAANNDAVIEDQRQSPALLTVVHVDDNAVAPGNGGPVEPYPTISQAVPRVMVGGMILVADGIYLEEVTLNKAGVHLLGAGYETTTIMGRKDTGGAHTLVLAANNLLVDGFTITRDGNNTADWASNVKNQGVIFLQGTTSSTLQNCRVTGNRNGVYLNNTQNHTVRNNIITDNRTGIQLANDVTGLLVTENDITDNWTLGLLFNFNTGFYTTSVNITNNNISGNWYGEVQNRWQDNDGVMNVAGNWFGTADLTFNSVNSTEPSYLDLIPVAYGGTATPPATPPASIGGVQSATVDYSPWLNSGTDTDPATMGFQGDFSILNVDDDSAQIDALNPVQEGIDTATSGGTVNVWDGTYNGSFMVDKPLTLKSKNGASSTVLHGGLVSPAIYVVSIRASDVTVDGFTVTNPVYNSPNADVTGIMIGYYGDNDLANIKVINNIVTEIGAADRNLDTVDGYPSVGIVLNGVVDGVEIANNTIHDIYQTVSSNDVTWGATGIGIYGYGATPLSTLVSVHDNEVYNISATNLNGASAVSNGIRFGWGSGDGTISNNLIHNVAGRGIHLSNTNYGSVAINSNEIYDSALAGVAIGNMGGGSLLGNNIYQNGSGILLSADVETPVTAHFNRIVENTTGIDNLSTVAVNAENNWWGCNGGPNLTGCDTTNGDVDADPWLVLNFTADQTMLVPGGVINLLASLNQNSAGADTSAQGTLMDGIPAAFATTYGTLNPLNTGLVNGNAAATLTVPEPVTVAGATVTATVDNQVVEIEFGFLRYIFLPIIFR